MLSKTQKLQTRAHHHKIEKRKSGRQETRSKKKDRNVPGDR